MFLFKVNLNAPVALVTTGDPQDPDPQLGPENGGSSQSSLCRINLRSAAYAPPDGQ